MLELKKKYHVFLNISSYIYFFISFIVSTFALKRFALKRNDFFQRNVLSLKSVIYNVYMVVYKKYVFLILI